MTRVLVTGASGYLGGAIWRRLTEREDTEARAVMRTDLLDEASIAKTLSGWMPDVVVHAAGRTHGSADALGDDNVGLTRRLAEALTVIAPATRLILMGSAAQYGASEDRIPWREDAACHPLDAYGASKLEAERAAFEAGARVTALRIFNVVAPAPCGPQVFSTFLRKAAEVYTDQHPWEIELGALDSVRDFVVLSDMVTAATRAIDRDLAGATINICTGHGRTAGELVWGVVRALSSGTIRANTGASGVPWSVGDPTCCEALLGFTPSADLAALTQEAAAWIKAEARTHA